MRIVCLLIVLSFLLSCASSTKPESESPPHIIFLVGHEQDATNYGFMGSEGVYTPHLDTLANHGVTFTQAYLPSENRHVNQRTLLTGIFPRHYDNLIDSMMQEELKVILFKDKEQHAEWKKQFPGKALQHIETLPRILEKKGYTTYYAGADGALDYTLAGFQHGPAQEGLLSDSPDRSDWDHWKQIKAGVLNFISTHADAPLFLWVAPPPCPDELLVSFHARYDNQDLTETELDHAAQCSCQDEVFGDFITSFNELRPDDATLVVYANDSGIKGTKNAAYHTPVIISGLNDVLHGQRLDDLVHVADIAPTMLDLIQAPVSVDGYSYKPVMLGQPFRPRKSIFGSNWIRNRNYFFTWDEPTGTTELYDLIHDPKCTDNVVHYHPAKVGGYKKELKNLTTTD